MDNTQLQNLVEGLSLKYFGKPFLHKATFNPRLRTTGGRYILSTCNIEINKIYLETFGLLELEGIIKHELCHYHLHIEGKGYKHRDRDFKILMKEVRAPRHCSTLPDLNKKGASTVYAYYCKSCKVQFKRKRRVNTERFVCGKCKGKIQLISNELK